MKVWLFGIVMGLSSMSLAIGFRYAPDNASGGPGRFVGSSRRHPIVVDPPIVPVVGKQADAIIDALKKARFPLDIRGLNCSTDPDLECGYQVGGPAYGVVGKKATAIINALKAAHVPTAPVGKPGTNWRFSEIKCTPASDVLSSCQITLNLSTRFGPFIE